MAEQNIPSIAGLMITDSELVSCRLTTSILYGKVRNCTLEDVKQFVDRYDMEAMIVEHEKEFVPIRANYSSSFWSMAGKGLYLASTRVHVNSRKVDCAIEIQHEQRTVTITDYKGDTSLTARFE